MKNRTISTNSESILNFECLKDKDVISAQVSDHHPVLHDGVLFWNIMMQARKRISSSYSSYNNGFGIEEEDEDYELRLTRVAAVIAELVKNHPNIKIIGLCEGPIKLDHVNVFYTELTSHAEMQRFHDGCGFKKPTEAGHEWGLLMLADIRYQITKKATPDYLKTNELVNRFQMWELRENSDARYYALAHFPFAGDEYVSEVTRLSERGMNYRGMVKKLKDEHDKAYQDFVISADYNFNPVLIEDEWKKSHGYEIPTHNSVLLSSEKIRDTKTVTVDGILLSRLAKQKLYSTYKFALFAKIELSYHALFEQVKSRQLSHRNNVKLKEPNSDDQTKLALVVNSYRASSRKD